METTNENTAPPAPKTQRCLCCGAAPAPVYKLRDGRLYAACDNCRDRCEYCRPTLQGAEIAQAGPLPAELPDLARTAAAIKAYDVVDVQFQQAVVDALYARATALSADLDYLGLAVAVAYAADTADRNTMATCLATIQPGAKVPPTGGEISFVRRMVAKWQAQQVAEVPPDVEPEQCGACGRDVEACPCGGENEGDGAPVTGADIAALDEFTRAYLECALWSTTDNDGERLDQFCDLTDIARECLDKAIADCAAFQLAHQDDLRAVETGLYRGMAMSGHDFWLNRNGHGTGFWDRAYGAEQDLQDTVKRLSDACEALPGVYLYVGDDGKIYC